MTWTPQDDEVVANYISQHANNLAYAFQLAAQELGRSTGAVTNRYYSKLKTGQKMTALITRRGMMVNTKNSPRPENEMSVDVMNFLVAKLSRQQKLELIKQLLS